MTKAQIKYNHDGKLLQHGARDNNNGSAGCKKISAVDVVRFVLTIINIETLLYTVNVLLDHIALLPIKMI